jgi:hypothetical protein
VGFASFKYHLLSLSHLNELDKVSQNLLLHEFVSNNCSNQLNLGSFPPFGKENNCSPILVSFGSLLVFGTQVSSIMSQLLPQFQNFFTLSLDSFELKSFGLLTLNLGSFPKSLDYPVEYSLSILFRHCLPFKFGTPQKITYESFSENLLFEGPKSLSNVLFKPILLLFDDELQP